MGGLPDLERFRLAEPMFGLFDIMNAARESHSRRRNQSGSCKVFAEQAKAISGRFEQDL